MAESLYGRNDSALRDWNGTLRRTLRYAYLFSILKIQWLLQNQRLAMRAT
jgi:hypothetical protein